MSVQIDTNNSVIMPEAVFIIGTYDENGVPNAMNAAWGTQTDFNEIVISLSKHKTTDNLEKTGAFTVAFGTVDTVTICDYFGVESGNKVNKIEKAGCHVRKSELVNAPIIEEFPLTLECRVKSWKPEEGILVGEIVAEQADDSIMTEDGHVDLDKMKPIIYDSAIHAYRSVGPVVARAFEEGFKIKKSVDVWDN
ncbi:MAG: flavin reductase family protein [Saccharofermentans sp.]|nr:flavin reductase family protein [Saccharofermentans sp.]